MEQILVRWLDYLGDVDLLNPCVPVYAVLALPASAQAESWIENGTVYNGEYPTHYLSARVGLLRHGDTDMVRVQHLFWADANTLERVEGVRVTAQIV